MDMSAFCVGRGKSSANGNCFQSRFNETFATRFRFEPAAGGDLAAKVTTYSSSRLLFADIRSSSHTMSLLPGRAAAPTEGQFLLTFQAEGSATVRQSDRQTTAAADDFFLIDTTRPFQIASTDVYLKSIYLPADTLREAFPAADLCTAVATPTRGSAGRVVRAAVDELFDLAVELDHETIARLATMLPHALSVAFGPHLRSYNAVSSDQDDHHRARIMDFVRRHLRDPDLDTSVIAAAVGLSVRYLHALFASEPETLMRWIRKERLTRIKNELANPALSRRPVATVAYGWGFSDPAHFSRTFKAAHGISPRDFRETVKLAPPSQDPMGPAVMDCRSTEV